MVNATMRPQVGTTVDLGATDVERAMFLVRDVTETGDLLTIVLERLRRSPASDPTDAPTLTRRETEILQLIATGLRTRAIAARLHVSPATVRNHVQHIFDKLGAHNRLEAVAHARRQRWL